jgi:hypothetical protein
MSLCKGYTQVITRPIRAPDISADSSVAKGGSNADNVLADAYVKGIQEGIDVCSVNQTDTVVQTNIPC